MPPSVELQTNVTTLFVFIVGVFNESFESALPVKFVVIASLAMGEADSASQLCKGISYDAGAMTRMIDRLESKGLIRRRRDADDRRLVNIELTEQGREAFPKMRQCAMGVLNRFLRGFTQNEARQLESFLNRMLENS